MMNDLQRAQTTLATARQLIDVDPTSSINRAYYAAFCAARAAVRLHGSAPKTHPGLSREVGRLLVPSQVLSSQQARFYSSLQTKRELFDYGEDEVPSSQEAARVTEEASRLIAALAPHLELE